MRKYALFVYLLIGSAIFGFLSLQVKNDEPYRDAQVSNYVYAPKISTNENVLSFRTIDEKAKIYYTLDGSIPTEGNAVRYTAPEDLSLFRYNSTLLRKRTSHRYKAPLTWELPFKAKIVRYSQQLPHLGYSKPRMKTVFSKLEAHDIPIVSIAVNESDLFDPVHGKMMMGKDHWERDRRGVAEPWWAQEANYRQGGFKSSVYAGVQFIDPELGVIYDDNVRLRIHGNASRAFAQKSIRLEGESYYGSGMIADYFGFISRVGDAPVFPAVNSTDINNGQFSGDSLQSMMLRNSGNDWGRSMFQDAYIQSISSKIGVPGLLSQPVHVMINGVYWGLYNARPRFDEKYLRQFGDRDGRLALIELDSELDEGKAKDLEDYINIKAKLDSKTLTHVEKIEILKQEIDIGNYIDYIIIETFFANGDWNPNNLKVFRLSKKDKWKWAIHDMDYCMTYVGVEEGVNANMFEKLKKANTVTSSIFRFLTADTEFKSMFRNRAKELIAEELASDRLNANLELFKIEYQRDMPYQVARWQQPGSMVFWYEVIDGFYEFNSRRPDIYLNQLEAL